MVILGSRGRGALKGYVVFVPDAPNHEVEHDADLSLQHAAWVLLELSCGQIIDSSNGSPEEVAR